MSIATIPLSDLIFSQGTKRKKTPKVKLTKHLLKSRKRLLLDREMWGEHPGCDIPKMIQRHDMHIVHALFKDRNIRKSTELNSIAATLTTTVGARLEPDPVVVLPSDDRILEGRAVVGRVQLDLDLLAAVLLQPAAVAGARVELHHERRVQRRVGMGVSRQADRDVEVLIFVGRRERHAVRLHGNSLKHRVDDGIFGIDGGRALHVELFVRGSRALMVTEMREDKSWLCQYLGHEAGLRFKEGRRETRKK